MPTIGVCEDQEPIRRVLVRALRQAGHWDQALQQRIDTWAADAAVFGVRRYGGELTAVITVTVARWDGREAANRIELQVGRDLQFIRINGTIVGGLVGVAIHGISSLIA